MGTVYREKYTKPLPTRSELFTKSGERFARWKRLKGKTRTAPVTAWQDGTDRIMVTSGTYVAKFRDGNRRICKVSTGCRDEDAARSILSKLERRAELVKSEVISHAEAATADHQRTPLAEHFAAYCDYLRARQASAVRIANMQSQFNRVADECGFRRLSDLDGGPFVRWMNEQTAAEMGAATRNGYRETLIMFANWCVQNHRLTANSFKTVPKADTKSDRRRQRRSMTEAELVKLLQVARMRPLAEYGRETARLKEVKAEATGARRKRSNWSKAALKLDTIKAAVEQARERLAKNSEFVEKLERLGRERALIYKTLALTGLRRNELASLTVGQLELDGAMPFVVLDAADEKNRQGSTIPLRADLANDLRDWLSDTPKPSTLRLRDGKGTDDSKRPLFTVPAGLARILDRDLLAAGIAKRDERGRTIDVHALRHSLGTLLSKGGVAPRTAQAAMRHSSIDLTMNVYTDPKLLDVHGALNSLPSLDLDSSPSTELQTMRATGTDDQGSKSCVISSDKPSSQFAPAFAPNSGKRGQSVSFAVISSDVDDERPTQSASDENITMPSEKASPAVFGGKALKVGMTGFEPAASTSRT